MNGFHNSLDHFSDLLEERFSQKIFTTEDSIRYTFFHSIISKMNISLKNIILESNHIDPQLNKSKIDAVMNISDDDKLVFEFKFHREHPNSRLPKTDKAGELFFDIFRLCRYKNYDSNSRCFLVYLTDGIMKNYFTNPNNKYDNFFNMKIDTIQIIDENFLKEKSSTFFDHCGKVYPCKIKSIFKKKLTSYSIRIYEILTI